MEIREAARLIHSMSTSGMFWNDKKAVQLFYKWLSSSKGQSLVQAIECMYRKYGLSRLAPFWVEELKIYDNEIEESRLFIWEEVAVEMFRSSYLGPLCIRVALQFCRYNDMVEEVANPKWEPGLVFWDNPDLNLLMQRMMKDVCEAPESNHHQVDIQKIERRVSHMRNTSDNKVYLAEAHQLFNVTKAVCQLIYTWLYTRDGLSCLTELQKLHTIDMANASGNLSNGKDYPYLLFLYNAGKSWARVKLTSSQIDQLEAWCRTRSSDSLYLAPSAFAPASNVTKVDTSIILKLVTETKASIGNIKEKSILDFWLDEESPLRSLRREVEPQAFISRVRFSVDKLACLLRSWLKSPTGKLHNQFMVTAINQAYKEFGLNSTCHNSSFVDEVRHCLAMSYHLPPPMLELWSKCAPAPIRAIGCERSFVNLVAVTCGDVGEETASVSVLEYCRFVSFYGGFHMVNELLEPVSGESVNQVIFQLLEEICAPKYSQDVRGPQTLFPQRSWELSALVRKSLEARFQKPTVFDCFSNTNKSLLRYFTALPRGSNSIQSDDKPWNEFVRCMHIYKIVGEMSADGIETRPLTEREVEQGRKVLNQEDVTYYMGDQDIREVVFKILKQTCNGDEEDDEAPSRKKRRLLSYLYDRITRAGKHLLTNGPQL